MTYGLAVRQASHKVSPTELRGNFIKLQTKKNLVFRQGFLVWLHSTGLEPVTYGLAVRQASHKVSPTELRGDFIKLQTKKNLVFRQGFLVWLPLLDLNQ